MEIFYSLLIFSLILTIHCEELPADIPKCHSEDHICITRVSNYLIQKYYGGRSDLNIPSIDPFFIKNVDINLPGGNAIDLEIKLNDVLIVGMSSINIDKSVGFTKDPLTSKFEMYATIPQFEFYGNYTANGRVLVLPFQGDGRFKIVLKNSQLSFRFKPKVYKKADGLTYLKLDKLKLHLEPGSVNMNFKNLFGGNEELGKIMNTLINENWRELWDEFAPTTYKIAEQIVKDITSGIFDRFDYDHIYLD